MDAHRSGHMPSGTDCLYGSGELHPHSVPHLPVQYIPEYPHAPDIFLYRQQFRSGDFNHLLPVRTGRLCTILNQVDYEGFASKKYYYKSHYSSYYKAYEKEAEEKKS